MTQHTPGPWMLHDMEFATIVTKKKPGQFIAVCDAARLGKMKECSANARLIAAAPETAAERDRLKDVNAQLLSALQEALAPFKVPAWNPSGLPVGEPEWCSKARAAIDAAKAPA